jgi:hypothetical protein
MRRFAAEIFCERATIEVPQGRLIAPIIQASILSKAMSRLLGKAGNITCEALGGERMFGKQTTEQTMERDGEKGEEDSIASF